MSMCDNSHHTGLGVGMELTNQYWDTVGFDFYKLNLYGLGYSACHAILEGKQRLAPQIVVWVTAWELYIPKLFCAAPSSGD